MNTWWEKLSLKSKLQLPIQLILLVIMVLAQRAALNTFEERVLEEARQKAEVSADGVLNGLNMLMLNGIISDADQRKLYVEKMGASNKVLELRVMRNKPVIDQFGPGLPSEQAQDEMDRQALATGQQQTSLEEKSGKSSLRVVVPFIARQDFRGTNCLMCHTVPEGSVNGAASITLDMSEEIAMIAKANAMLWGAQVLVQVLLYFLIGWLISIVTRPTHELQQAMVAMQAMRSGQARTGAQPGRGWPDRAGVQCAGQQFPDNRVPGGWTGKTGRHCRANVDPGRGNAGGQCAQTK